MVAFNWTFLGGLGLGAGLMYALDPDRGARRRALVRDKVVSGLKSQGDMLGKGARDIKHRAGGLAHRLRSPARSDVSDRVLEERVRATLGRHATHPHAIEVEARRGHIVLSGAILSGEVDDLIEAVRKVPGVTGVSSMLEPHDSSESVPELQGPGHLPARNALAREVWPPALRLAATGAGSALALYGLRRGGRSGGALTAAGAALLVRATTNLPVRRLVGVGAGRRAVDLEKTIAINAPIEQVYEFLTHIENFPRFMSHVQQVRPGGDERSHWKISGPGGISMSWDAQVTRRDPERAVAWKTLPGAVVEHAGIIHFTRAGDDATRIQIRMSYNPPAGAIGHALLRLLGSDPRRMMDEDLVRLKSLLEEGRTRVHGETVTERDLH